eukprot:3935579-Rhodomonas_salina.1
MAGGPRSVGEDNEDEGSALDACRVAGGAVVERCTHCEHVALAAEDLELQAVLSWPPGPSASSSKCSYGTSLPAPRSSASARS